MSAERMVQYVKEGTEAFDDLSGRALERALNRLSSLRVHVHAGLRAREREPP